MPEPRIEKIALVDIGPFRDTEIAFGEPQAEGLANVHLITGPNGSGKTTLLEALALIFSDASSAGTPQRLHFQERFRSPESRLDFVFDGLPGDYGPYNEEESPSSRFGQVMPWDNVLERGYQYRYGGQGELVDFRSPSAVGREFSFGAFAYSGLRTLRAKPLRSIEPVARPPLENALSFETSIRPEVLLQWIANNRAQWALALADGSRAEAGGYQESLSRITQFVGDVCELEIDFRLERSPLRVAVFLEGESVPMNALPDGLKSILSWVGDMVLRLDAIPWRTKGDALSQRVFLFLDEIDIHLHPKWQRMILPSLQKLLPNAEVFASTHSPFVVASVEDAWIYSLPERSEGPVSIVPQPAEAGQSYSVVLKEIFSVDDEFDPHTEDLLDSFYRHRESILEKGQSTAEFLDLAKQLAERGEEAKAIVSRELRQLSRRLGEELCLS